MKKILLFALLIALAFSGVSYGFSGPDEGDAILRATGARQSIAPRVVKLVRLSDSSPNGTDLASGDVVVYDTNSADGISVRTTTTSADGAIAGVVIGTIQTGDCATTTALGQEGRRNWGFIVVHGPALADGVGTGVSAGDAFITSVDATKIVGLNDITNAATVNNVALVDATTKGGFYLNVNSSSTQQKVFVTLQ